MNRYPKIGDTKDRLDSQGRKLCRNCDEIIARNRKHYCSERCLNEFTRNNYWPMVRKDVLRRDKYICQICGGKFLKKELEVDHIKPIKYGGDFFNKDNLRSVCIRCHKIKSKFE